MQYQKPLYFLLLTPALLSHKVCVCGGYVGVVLGAVLLSFKWCKQVMNDQERALTLLPDLSFSAFPFLSPCCTLGRRYFRVVRSVSFAGISFHFEGP